MPLLRFFDFNFLLGKLFLFPISLEKTSFQMIQHSKRGSVSAEEDA